MRLILLAFLLLTGSATAAAPATGLIRVRLVTSVGAITVALDSRRAPKTTANFLAYVDDERLAGTSFYRAARRAGRPGLGFIQGGIDTDVRRSLNPVLLERTDVTGIRHLDATISMARNAREGSATGNFFITAGATPAMDARGEYGGYAAFGRVVGGMDVVRRILALPTGGGEGPMRGQMILRPVRLIAAVRLDGAAHPTGQVKPWLLRIRH